MFLVTVNYAGAEDKGTVDPPKDKTSRPLKGYLPLSANQTFYVKEGMTKETEKTDFLNCIEGQRRIQELMQKIRKQNLIEAITVSFGLPFSV